MTMQNAEILRVVGEGQARVNVTWAGQNADLPDSVPVDMTEADLKAVVSEALTGGFGGIPAAVNADLTNYVVDRFAATEQRPYPLFSLRPKTPFG